MQAGISRQDGLGRADEVRVAVERGDQAARLLHDQRAGGHVPGVEALFSFSIKPPSGDIAKIKGYRTQAAHTLTEPR